MRSGQQDGVNKYNSWLSFCVQVPNHIPYAMAVLDISVIYQLDRALPVTVQRDTAGTSSAAVATVPPSSQRVIDESCDNTTSTGKRKLSTSVGAVNRRRQRQRLRELHARKSNENISTITSRSNDESNIKTVLQDYSKTATVGSRDQALQVILTGNIGVFNFLFTT